MIYGSGGGPSNEAPCVPPIVFRIRAMTPLDNYFDHGQRPRNMGRMLDAHGTGNIGSIVAGRALRWFVTIEGDRIAASKFQVFACQEQVAAASILSEIIIGKSIADCLHLGHADIAAHIGGLDLAELPPQIWGIAALHDALAHLTDAEGGFTTQLDDPAPEQPLICRCHHVDEPTVKELVRGGAHDLAAITEHSPVGTGCGTCRRDVERLIRETLDAPDPEAAGTGAAISNGAKGRVALMHSIVGLLQPMLAEVEGPSPEIWDLQKNVVILRALPGDWDVLQDRCERLLKDEVDPLLKVEIDVK